MVTLTAVFYAKPGCEMSLQKVLKNMLSPSRNESGCISYVLLNAIDQPSKFVFQEQFKDDEAFSEHTKTDYFNKMISEATPLLQDSPEITFYSVITE
ncbi:antibiotic biosynthesis monooxygenase [Aeromonas hydrophila]|uniref:putative quinol monooxygenase n=1 Tax=Aeromonas hydrophila TaxID=644 RepID=UPI001B3A2BF4|nr:putative quinol monooxygenase [Aeromonas hydrophila]MBQ4676527.1 antibiotic biosynthesis monooxygenase [Aeromonas hydrophila]MBW3813132.1 antibiotic biosynthesis monooxygenase [Aeromonas hydrophila]MCF7678364.1 antibiotic biosynthesis monooxygenase [Aeromonas hydrophila]MCF7691412.1 antibiotic biosynthesis monooxygenase [Aeromonas hydrophila]MCF7774142.1 antibiotic biosynthesis monooxygenase [Aeromonas hydrophila]